jgi:hypothetical protein
LAAGGFINGFSDFVRLAETRQYFSEVQNIASGG